MNLKAIKKMSISLGFYRQARTLYRYLNQSERDAYTSDKKFYAQLLPQKGLLCFDVGANIGRMTQVLLELGNKVIAFEPQPDCIREIEARCGQYGPRLHIEPVGLSDSPGAASLFVRELSGQSSLMSTWEGVVSGSISIPLSTLDAAIEKFGLPYYCKIDVEGWELQVLRGLTQPLPLLSFEFHQNDGKMESAYACLDRLSALSSIKVNLTPREQSHLALDEWVGPDQFKDIFEKEFNDKERFHYGDIYVSSLESPPKVESS